MITYRQWVESNQRDEIALVIEPHKNPQRVYYDRFVRAFVLPDSERIVSLEEFLDAFARH